MGQIEVYELMRDIRSSGNNEFFCTHEIELKLKEKGFSNGILSAARGDLLRLEMSGYLESKMTGKLRDWKRLFRLKEKYIYQ